MLKKFVAVILVVVMGIGGGSNVFAASNMTNEYQVMMIDGIEKSIVYIGDNKVICWDEGDYIITEQYDISGDFICRAIGNRITGDIIVTNDTNAIETTNIQEMGFSNIRDSSSTKGIGLYTSVGKIGASNVFTHERKQMQVYESLSGKKTTTYTFQKYNGTLATFITSVAIGLALSNVVASAIVISLVSAGIGTIVGSAINITSSDTVAATRYDTSYYGQDISTGRSSSKITNSGYKYIVTDDLSKLKDEIFFAGSYYNPKDFDASLSLLDRLVDNLYGVDFTPYEI